MKLVQLEATVQISLSVERYNALIDLENRKCGSCKFWDDSMVKNGGLPRGNKHGYCEAMTHNREHQAYLVDEFASGSLRPTADFSCSMFERKA